MSTSSDPNNVERLKAKIAANNHARQDAGSIIELMREIIASTPQDSLEHFINPIFYKALEFFKIPPQTGDKMRLPMTDEQARKFGQNTQLPYGEFKGQSVDSVALDRLQWYADQTFTDDLRRYLSSKRVQAEITNQTGD